MHKYPLYSLLIHKSQPGSVGIVRLLFFVKYLSTVKKHLDGMEPSRVRWLSAVK